MLRLPLQLPIALREFFDDELTVGKARETLKRDLETCDERFLGLIQSEI